MLAAVIGNGPGPVGRGLGAEIDAADVVIRLHDCHYQTPEDYGTRYDYGVLPGPWIQTALRGVRRVPDRGWLIYHFGFEDGVRGVDNDQGRYDFNAFNMVANVSGKAPSGRRASLSRGFCAIVMTARLKGFDRVRAYGFDALAGGQHLQEWANPPDYKAMVQRDMPDVRLYNTSAVHHDAELERRLLLSEVPHLEFV